MVLGYDERTFRYVENHCYFFVLINLFLYFLSEIHKRWVYIRSLNQK